MDVKKYEPVMIDVFGRDEIDMIESSCGQYVSLYDYRTLQKQLEVCKEQRNAYVHEYMTSDSVFDPEAEKALIELDNKALEEIK